MFCVCVSRLECFKTFADIFATSAVSEEQFMDLYCMFLNRHHHYDTQMET